MNETFTMASSSTDAKLIFTDCEGDYFQVRFQFLSTDVSMLVDAYTDRKGFDKQIGMGACGNCAQARGL